MKKLIVFFIAVLLLSTLPVQAKANYDLITYDELLQYDDFTKAMYEGYVTNTAYIAAKQTDNLNYINGIIDTLKTNAKSFWEGLKNEECNNDPDCNWPIEFYKQLIATGFTGLQFIKDFFFEEQEQYYFYDDTWYNQYIGWSAVTNMVALSGYEFIVKDTTPTIKYGREIAAASSYDWALIKLDNNYLGSTGAYWSNTWAIAFNEQNRYSPTAFILAANKMGVTIAIRSTGTNEEVTPNIDSNYQAINNYIQNINNTTQPIPVIQNKLVCPTMTYDSQFINGNFVVNGTPLTVDKTTSQTIYNNESCNMQFIVPIPELNEDNRLIVDNGDGTTTDIETGEQLDENGEIITPTEPTPDCDGILCWVSNIFSVIGKVISAITNLGTTIINGIFSLIVPDDLNFITDLFDGLKTTISEKFSIATEMQNLFKSIFTESTTNPLTGLSFTIPATDTELSFDVFAVVDDYVPMIKRIISALLALMTLMYVYRKITGSGGVMEK